MNEIGRYFGRDFVIKFNVVVRVWRYEEGFEEDSFGFKVNSGLEGIKWKIGR